MASSKSAGLESLEPALQRELAGLLPGLSLEFEDQLDSTNAELMRRARAGHGDPVLLVAALQTAGRGRMGRTWHGKAGAALTFSMGLSLAPADWSGLSLAIGLSLADSLHPDIRIKWPNDLYADGGKVGGILVETATLVASCVTKPRGRYVVVGVGLNLQTPSGLETGVRAAGLDAVWPECDRLSVLQRVARPLTQALLDFERQGFAPLQAAYQRRDALAGCDVIMSDGTTGRAMGVDARGALRVHSQAGERTIDTLEVSVRPIQRESAGVGA